MLSLIKNPIKKRKKKKRRPYLEKERLEAFRPTAENQCYLDGLYNNKSEFVNKAISFYILLINQPMRILKELKRQRPKLYKFVGRKKFT